MAKSKKSVGKMVDAQAKGQKTKGAKTDERSPNGGKLDTRISKDAKKGI